MQTPPRYKKFKRLLNVDPEKVPHFEYRGRFFHRDESMRRFFASSFDLKLKAVYVSRQPESYERAVSYTNVGGRRKSVHFGKATIVFFMESGKVVELADDASPYMEVFISGRDEWKD